MKTQNERILAHLQKGRKITQLEALNKFDCFRLASRISDLRADGHPIESETIETKSGKHVARYFMSSSGKPNGQKLDMPIIVSKKDVQYILNKKTKV